MRCSGTTQAGERCKRSVPEGQTHCVDHADQAVEHRNLPVRLHPPDEPVDASTSYRPYPWSVRDWADAFLEGLVVVTAVAASFVLPERAKRPD